MNKRMRRKHRWDITAHYDRHPWFTYASQQSKTTFDKLVRQAMLDDTIEMVCAFRTSYQKTRVLGGMFLIEKRKIRCYSPTVRKPHFRENVNMRFFVSNEQLKRDAKAYERYCTPDEEFENE